MSIEPASAFVQPVLSSFFLLFLLFLVLVLFLLIAVLFCTSCLLACSATAENVQWGHGGHGGQGLLHGSCLPRRAPRPVVLRGTYQKKKEKKGRNEKTTKQRNRAFNKTKGIQLSTKQKEFSFQQNKRNSAFKSFRFTNDLFSFCFDSGRSFARFPLIIFLLHRHCLLLLFFSVSTASKFPFLLFCLQHVFLFLCCGS